jgi:hypothetical protein
VRTCAAQDKIRHPTVVAIRLSGVTFGHFKIEMSECQT